MRIIRIFGLVWGCCWLLGLLSFPLTVFAEKDKQWRDETVARLIAEQGG